MSQDPTAQQVIAAAVAAAGGAVKAAARLGITSQSISGWLQAGRVPAYRIVPLCELGNNTVTPSQLLEAMARKSGGKRRAA